MDGIGKINICLYNAKGREIFHKIAKLVDNEYIGINDFDFTRTDYGVYLNGGKSTYPIKIYMHLVNYDFFIKNIERLSTDDDEGYTEISDFVRKRVIDYLKEINNE